MSDYKYERFKVSDILLDINNPRFNQVSTQREAILAMLEEQNKKLYELALDIVEYGLDPSKRHIIFKENKSFIDGDGNRRLTVLKVLETPDLIKGKSLYKKFKKLALKNKQKINEVDCVVFKDRGAIRHWLEVNHLGELGGRGQIKWNAVQKERFKGSKSIALHAKDFLLKKKLVSKADLEKVPHTTLDRLLTSKPGKEALKIKKEGDSVMFGEPQRLKIVFNELIGKNVNSVYYDKDRRDFLQSALKEELTDSKKTKSKTRRVKPSNKPIFGKTLTLKEGRVNNIYRDICEIYKFHQSSGNYLEILAFSMRLILDAAAREYFDKNPKEIKNKDAVYKDYITLIKRMTDQKGKNTLSLNTDIESLLKEEKVEALLGKFAHDAIHIDAKMVLNLSFIIGQILEIHFSKEGA